MAKNIWLLANTVGREAALLQCTDTGDNPISSQDGVSAVRGGPRHLRYAPVTGNSADRIAYVNLDGTLTADFMVMVNAKFHSGYVVDTVEFTSYATIESNVDSRTLGASDFIGTTGRDWVLKFTKESNKQGFAVEFSSFYSKEHQQIYFCEGLGFAENPAGMEIEYQRVSIHDPPTLHFGNYYHLHAVANFTVSEVSRVDTDTYLELWREDPVFFYDESGTAAIGNAIEDKLWHCIILSERIVPVDDDSNRIEFRVGILRHWE